MFARPEVSLFIPAMAKTQEAWSSRLGVIMAVAGSAVGLGNFLRFPGLATQYGGAASSSRAISVTPTTSTAQANTSGVNVSPASVA